MWAMRRFAARTVMGALDIPGVLHEAPVSGYVPSEDDLVTRLCIRDRVEQLLHGGDIDDRHDAIVLDQRSHARS
jgi:hypothetical protein